MHNANKYSVQSLLANWPLFAKKPKGFGKFFDGEETTASDSKKSEPTETKDPPKSRTPPTPTPTPAQPKKKDDGFFTFNFGKKYQSSGGGSGGSGNPLGDNGTNWFLGGLLGTTAIIGLYAYMNMAYQEVSWREFITK